jgi:hypothetical protein
VNLEALRDDLRRRLVSPYTVPDQPPDPGGFDIHTQAPSRLVTSLRLEGSRLTTIQLQPVAVTLDLDAPDGLDRLDQLLRGHGIRLRPR